jgi:hypothetical protein
MNIFNFSLIFHPRKASEIELNLISMGSCFYMNIETELGLTMPKYASVWAPGILTATWDVFGCIQLE